MCDSQTPTSLIVFISISPVLQEGIIFFHCKCHKILKADSIAREKTNVPLLQRLKIEHWRYDRWIIIKKSKSRGVKRCFNPLWKQKKKHFALLETYIDCKIAFYNIFFTLEFCV